jgi:hypothetical protein
LQRRPAAFPILINVNGFQEETMHASSKERTLIEECCEREEVEKVSIPTDVASRHHGEALGAVAVHAEHDEWAALASVGC